MHFYQLLFNFSINFIFRHMKNPTHVTIHINVNFAQELLQFQVHGELTPDVITKKNWNRCEKWKISFNWKKATTINLYKTFVPWKNERNFLLMKPFPLLHFVIYESESREEKFRLTFNSRWLISTISIINWFQIFIVKLGCICVGAIKYLISKSLAWIINSKKLQNHSTKAVFTLLNE